MNAYKIDLKPYPFKVQFDGTGKEASIPETVIHPKGRLIDHLFSPNCNHSPQELFEIDRIVKEIRKLDDSLEVCELLLHEPDFATVKQALEKLTGYFQRDLEWVRRIWNAEKVEVSIAAAAPPPKKK